MTREEAWELLTEYNQDAFHLKHAQTVEGVMKYFARELGYADQEEFWGIVGLLHDLDFEQYPEEHCIRSQQIMRERGGRRTSSTPPPATDMPLRWISGRSMRWRRCCMPRTSSPG